MLTLIYVKACFSNQNQFLLNKFSDIEDFRSPFTGALSVEDNANPLALYSAETSGVGAFYCLYGSGLNNHFHIYTDIFQFSLFCHLPKFAIRLLLDLKKNISKYFYNLLKFVSLQHVKPGSDSFTFCLFVATDIF